MPGGEIRRYLSEVIPREGEAVSIHYDRQLGHAAMEVVDILHVPQQGMRDAMVDGVYWAWNAQVIVVVRDREELDEEYED